VSDLAPPIEARGLLKRYGHVTAVDNVDLTVERGDVYGFLGPNGAGKTTTLRMLLGLIRPDSGEARLFGRDPLKEGVRALDGVAGFVEAPRYYPYMSGRRNLELVAALDAGDAGGRIDDALHTVELFDRAGDKVGGYSHGMRQRLGIAGALIRDPLLLILDEPTTGLDPAGMRDMKRLVRRLVDQGITVLLSSHIMDEVEELCDRLAIVRSGRVIYEGRLDDLLHSTGQRYRVKTTDDRRALEIATHQPGVGEVRVEEDGTVSLAADEAAATGLSIALVEAGLGIRALVPAAASLEELFFRLTEGDGLDAPPSSNGASREAVTS
jgi:ABC-2 type transport system ATP-binding protein